MQRPRQADLTPFLLIGAFLLAKDALDGLFPGGDPDTVPPPYADPITEAPTLSANEIADIAISIRQLFQEFWGGEDEQGITELIWRSRNNADVASIVYAFGVLCYNFNLFNCMGLGASIKSYFSSWQLQSLNDGLSERGITYTF